MLLSMFYDDSIVWNFISLGNNILLKPFDFHCCHMGSSMKHPVPDHFKSSFVIF